MRSGVACHKKPMKSWNLWNWSLGVALAVLPLAGGCFQRGSVSADRTASVAEPQTDEAGADPDPEEAAAMGDPDSGSAVADAPATVISTEKALPPNVRTTGPLAEILKLAESGVDESVMLSFVTNAPSTFNLNSAEIIYLNDIGVSSSVVTAMIEHDHTLQEAATQSTLASAPPATPNSDLAVSPMASAPTYVGPPPDYSSEPDSAAPQYAEPDATYPAFYDSLAPYGTWVNIGGYGACWRPTVVAVNPTWQPYFDRGHWVYTDCGWYWLSDYSWGWAPFHYGRWFQQHRLCWCWRPDAVWGPCWVCWRYSGDYCGWAPLPPAACFRPGLGFTYRGHSVGFSFNFPIAASCFTFVPARNFCDFHLSRYAVNRDHDARFFHSTVAVTKIIGDNHRVI